MKNPALRGFSLWTRDESNKSDLARRDCFAFFRRACTAIPDSGYAAIDCNSLWGFSELARPATHIPVAVAEWLVTVFFLVFSFFA
ncbi:TPA: hypothetical protein ACJZVL_006063, partial [Pseudomonas aeruginosa]